MPNAAVQPPNHLLLRAIRGERVPRVPVWLMRQAGRSDPEYRAYRERAGLDLYTLFRSPEHAVPISLLPRRLGVDAIIMYQDILTPLEPMGATFRFAPGPVLEPPLREAAQVDALRPIDPPAQLGFVAETLAGLHRELAGELPVLGFAGAPFTLAAFMIRGSSPMKDMAPVWAFIREQPDAFARLMDKLTDMTIAYLAYQAEAGADAVQLFESVGDLVPQDVYERHLQPSHERICGALTGRVPMILFVRGSPFPEAMARTGAQVLSLGSGTDVGQVRRQGEGALPCRATWPTPCWPPAPPMR